LWDDTITNSQIQRVNYQPYQPVVSDISDSDDEAEDR